MSRSGSPAACASIVFSRSITAFSPPIIAKLRAFYSDTFVLPLPEHHRFPMAKYRLVRERLVADGILSADDLHVPEPVAWSDLLLVHDPGYVDAVATGTLPPDMQRRIGFPWSPQMVERSRRSVGATLAAARAVLGPADDLSGARTLQPSVWTGNCQPSVSANL